MKNTLAIKVSGEDNVRDQSCDHCSKARWEEALANKIVVDINIWKAKKGLLWPCVFFPRRRITRSIFSHVKRNYTILYHFPHDRVSWLFRRLITLCIFFIVKRNYMIVYYFLKDRVSLPIQLSTMII